MLCTLRTQALATYTHQLSEYRRKTTKHYIAKALLYILWNLKRLSTALITVAGRHLFKVDK